MAPGVQTDQLFDFLYRDMSRFTSLYAQIFGGHLSSIEQSDFSKSGTENTTGGSIGVSGTGLTGNQKSVKELTESLKRTVNPHDVTVTDVLAELRGSRKIADLPGAPHGSFVHAEGTLAFVDRSMLEFAVLAIDSHVEDEKKKKGQQRNHEFIRQMEQVKTLMGKLQLPSAFLLQTKQKLLIAGTLKETGLEEPIASYYFKHGTAGLANVHLIGIKEIPTTTFELPLTNLLAMGNKAAKALHDMMFPSDSTKVTPLALFRQL